MIKNRLDHELGLSDFYFIILTDKFHISCKWSFMEQKTTLLQSIDIVEQKERYDTACKKVFAEKIILAWFMKYIMKEDAYSITVA